MKATSSPPQLVPLATADTRIAEPMPRASSLPARSASRGGFVPLLLCTLTLLGWFGFQGVLLVFDRQALQADIASQQPTVDKAARLRTVLDALAADTQRMADAGNANAALLVRELRNRGITISVPGAGSVESPASAAPR